MTSFLMSINTTLLPTFQDTSNSPGIDEYFAIASLAN